MLDEIARKLHDLPLKRASAHERNVMSRHSDIRRLREEQARKREILRAADPQPGEIGGVVLVKPKSKPEPKVRHRSSDFRSCFANRPDRYSRIRSADALV